MREFSFTKKDFDVDWFSGTGPGGQNKNKVQACCRITHKQTGLRAQSTKHRNRASNQKDAFERLAQMIIQHYRAQENTGRDISETVIRTYHAERNEVRDHASDHRQSFKVVVDDLGGMIEARKESIGTPHETRDDLSN